MNSPQWSNLPRFTIYSTLLMAQIHTQFHYGIWGNSSQNFGINVGIKQSLLQDTKKGIQNSWICSLHMSKQCINSKTEEKNWYAMILTLEGTIYYKYIFWYFLLSTLVIVVGDQNWLNSSPTWYDTHGIPSIPTITFSL